MNDGGEATYRGDGSPIWGGEAERILKLTQRQLQQFSSTADADLSRIRADASRVFSRAVPAHGGPAKESELVVGRVQAGKTSNFTVVSGLARDNGYQLFIVLAGTKSELLDQTLRRLRKTLAAASPTSLPAFWVKRLAIGNEDTLAAELRTKLAAMRASSTGAGQAPVLVVLKEDDNLLSLQSTLSGLQRLLPLETVPTMVIDDEADQASPDSKMRSMSAAKSAVHAAIVGVRDLLPWHTFLAYTATPQANLLMELNGLLRPRYVTVIDSGGDYIGVNDLFGSASSSYAEEILDTPPQARRPPDSLKRALAAFLCQILLVRNHRDDVFDEPLRSSDDLACVTMLLNPASEMANHEVWRELAETVLDAWSHELADLDDLAARRLIDAYLQPAWTSFYESLHVAGKVTSMPVRLSDSDVSLLAELIAYIEKRTINSDTSKRGVRLPEDQEWNEQVAWLLVGGDIMGRGQTLKNLMTTYMPRAGGTGTIDTIQQRGRFYGYHAAYRPLLRGWFEPTTLRLYRDAVDSDASLIADLSDLDQAQAPLSDWTRAFVLGTGRLRATRRSVTPLAAREFKFSEWAFAQTYLLSDSVNASNAAVLDSFVQSTASTWSPWQAETRTERQDFWFSPPLSSLLALLNDWRAAGSEIDALAYLTLTLGTVLQELEHSTACIVMMDRDPSNSADLTCTSYRSLEGSRRGGGQSPGGGTPSDRIGATLGQRQRQVVDDTRITAQLHVFRVGDSANEGPRTRILADTAPALVVHLPKQFRQRYLTFDPKSTQ